MEELSDKKMIFVTIASKGNGRDDSEIREAWERALTGVVSPGVETIEKVTVLPAAPSKQDEQKPPETKSTHRISLIVREEEKPPPKFYYTLDDKQWWEIPGELIKVWQLRFMPRDIGVTEGVVKVRGELGDEKVQGLIRIKSAQKHVLELVER
jgi:hypothetical protein